jgi:hypothetical protein
MLACALCAVVLAFPAAARAGDLHCTVGNGYSTCNTSYGYNASYNVYNDCSAICGGIIWCYSIHTDGSNAGEYGTVQPGHVRNFWAGGYNHMHCQWYSGGEPIPVEILW